MATLDMIWNEIKSISVRIESIESSQKFISAKYEEIKELLNENSKENREIKESMAQNAQLACRLENRVRKMEQQLSSNKVVISGIPESKNENTEAVIQNLIGKAKIGASQVKTTRMGAPKKGKNRPILVTLKDEAEAYGLVQYSRQSKPTANLIHDSFAKEVRIFISAYLTPETKRLWDATYLRAKGKGFKFIWLSNGEILVRMKEGERIRHINSIEDAESLDEL